MKLIVGLGNPGKKYEKTWHNLGFKVVDEIAKRRKKGLILVKPQTFMNNSGKAVKRLVKNLKLKTEDLIVVHDDIDLPLGKIKTSKGRGSAGHKGVESIIKELGTKDFWRLRIGICPERGKPKNVEKFVLQNFTKETEKIIKEAAEKLNEIISG